MSSSNQWHYTDKTGKQCGPITQAALMELISNKSISSTSMVWKDGMPGWKPLSQMKELQVESVPQAPKLQSPPATPTSSSPQATSPATPTPSGISSPARSAATPESVDPYVAPNIPSDEEFYAAMPSMEYGGIGRFGYIIGYPLLYSLLAICGVFLVKYLEFDILSYALLGLLFILGIRLTCLRFINIGMSGWWILGFFIPLLNIILLLALYILPRGFAETRKLDIPAYIIGFFTLFPIIALIASIALGTFAQLLEQLMQLLP